MSMPIFKIRYKPREGCPHIKALLDNQMKISQEKYTIQVSDSNLAPAASNPDKTEEQPGDDEQECNRSADK